MTIGYLEMIVVDEENSNKILAAVATIISIQILYFWVLPQSKKVLQVWMDRRKLRMISKQSSKESDYNKVTVSSIHIHPIKSLRPISIQRAKLTHLGLEGDRLLMITRPSASSNQHRFLTQRQCPALATINCSLPTQITQTDENGKTCIKTVIKLSNDSQNTKILIDVTPQTLVTYPVRYNAGIWDDTVQVVDVGDKASSFIQSILSNEEDKFDDVRVVALLPEDKRRVDEKYCPNAVKDLFLRVPKVSLTDGFPILIASEESLQELNDRLGKKKKDKLPMSRFRPNIVIKGALKPFDEDEWKAIQIGENGPIFHVVKGCPRCKQSCTDQITGEKYDEPLETLKEFRALGKDPEAVYFAQNAIIQPGCEGMEIQVGDKVKVLTRGDPVWDMESVVKE